MSPLPKLLFELALDRAITLRVALGSLGRLRPADQAAVRLIKVTLEALDRLRLKCDQQREYCERITQSETFRYVALEKEGRVYNTFLEFLETQLYPVLQRAFSTDTPSEVVLPIRQLTSCLFPDSDILMISTPEMNYRFGQIGDMLRENFDNLGYADILDANKIPNSLWLLQVCAMPPSGILTHTLISHELGHGVYKTRDLGKEIMSHIRVNEKDVDDLVEKAASSQMRLSQATGTSAGKQRRLDDYIDRSIIKVQIQNQIEIVVRKWAEEFACDIIGMRLFGPAFFFAHIHFFIPFQKLDNASDTHPSARMRFRFCLYSLLGTNAGLGYRGANSVPLSKELEPWIKAMLEKMPRADDDILKIAYASVRPALPKILAACKKATRKFAYAPQAFDRDVPHLCERLSQVLPPNECFDAESPHGRAVNMISILNAAWIFHLGWLAPEPNLMKGLPLERRHLRLNGLVQKAIEMAELQRAWQTGASNGGS